MLSKQSFQHSSFNFMPNDFSTTWVFCAFIVAILVKISTGTSSEFFFTGILFLFSFAALASLSLGILTLFPLVFVLQSAPESVGAREVAIALLCTIICVRTIWDEVRAGKLNDHIHRLRWLAGLVVVLLFVNIYVAYMNDVPLTDWVRGFTPFIFIAMFFPISVLIANDIRLLNALILSLLALAMLYCGQVVIVYLYEGLYAPFFYVMDNGTPIQTDPASYDPAAGPLLGPFYYRVTNFTAQSTDALLPVSFVVGFVVFVLGRQKASRTLAGILAAVAIIAILMTYTRSMLACIVAVSGFFGIALLVFDRTNFRSALTKGLFLACFAVICIYAFGMDVVWNNRMIELYYSLGLNKYVFAISQEYGWMYDIVIDFMATWFSISGSDMSDNFQRPSLEEALLIEKQMEMRFGKDANIITRLVEYKIALEFFYSQPLTGAGLGIKHQISFATTHGEPLIQKVAFVHNWFYYFLMVAGIPGVLLYAGALFAPILRVGWSIRKAHAFIHEKQRKTLSIAFYVLWTALLTMAFYGLFFAVFRLITFNLLLAVTLGVSYALVNYLSDSRLTMKTDTGEEAS